MVMSKISVNFFVSVVRQDKIYTSIYIANMKDVAGVGIMSCYAT